jgi:hypothetical protein
VCSQPNLRMRNFLTAAAILLPSTSWAFLNATQDERGLTIANDRLVASVSKTRGYVNVLTLDGQNLLGTENGRLSRAKCRLKYTLTSYLDRQATPEWAHIWTAIAHRVASGHRVVEVTSNTSCSMAQTRQARSMAGSAWARHTPRLVRGWSSTGF